MQQLRRLETLKNEAVQNEDFQTAKEIKDRIHRLKNVGEQVALLESRKAKAIKKEDYDSAIMLKEEIERLRSQFEIGNMKSGGQDQYAEFGRRPANSMGRPANEQAFGNQGMGGMRNPSVGNQGMRNPSMGNQRMRNPNMGNPGMERRASPHDVDNMQFRQMQMGMKEEMNIRSQAHGSQTDNLIQY